MQEVIVGIIVAFAAFAVARRYAPAPVRQALNGWTARSARRIGLGRLAEKIEAKAGGSAGCGDGCGTCGGCGTANSASSARQFSISPEALKRTARR